jgi:phospholipid/cholesterol/gamma-HCH transport system ATP-binding protein
VTHTADTSDLVIRVRGVRTAFGSTVIHDGLDLDVRRGEIIGLVGGSGTGKSVLLETILGLKQPDAGTVEILGCNVHDQRQRDSIESRIGVMFQTGALFSA